MQRPIDRELFFNTVRRMFGGFTQSQVDGLNVLLDLFDCHRATSQEAAYMLATAFHETAKTMQPIAEYGCGAGRKYGQHLKMNGQPYPTSMPIYYGRGYVQLTWYENYEKAGRELGLDLLNHPELAMAPTYAARIMFTGMKEGWFTGKSLSSYIDDEKCDYVACRRIINGTDKADVIAGYARVFERALP